MTQYFQDLGAFSVKWEQHCLIVPVPPTGIEDSAKEGSILKLENAPASPGQLVQTDCWSATSGVLLRQSRMEPVVLHF